MAKCANCGMDTSKGKANPKSMTKSMDTGMMKGKGKKTVKKKGGK